MRIKLSELRNIVRSVIVESSQLPSRWYHGSPYGGMQSASDFKGPVMFLSDSEQVASQYKKQLIGTGNKPSDDVQDGPGVYAVALKFMADEVFDTRKPEHLALFHELCKEARLADPEDPAIRKSDLTSVHAAQGSSLSGQFPSYGCVRTLLQILSKRGFKAVITAEGAQGASLAVLNPQSNVELLDRS